MDGTEGGAWMLALSYQLSATRLSTASNSLQEGKEIRRFFLERKTLDLFALLFKPLAQRLWRASTLALDYLPHTDS
jgi:hypothetical protein